MPRIDRVGPSLVALGGMVVDHVEDHLQPGGVQGADHHLELLDRLARRLARCVAQLGAK